MKSEKTVIYLRLPATTVDAIKRRAELLGLSATAWCNVALRRALATDDADKRPPTTAQPE